MFKPLSYLILIIIVLSHPQSTAKYASLGLYNWATKIVPTLFPFMMISSLMANSGADTELGKLIGKLLKRIYPLSDYGLYAVFMGFFCGFPMGAKVTCELYTQGKISQSEADTLLSFCNNIGPSYFTGIIIPIITHLGYREILPFLFGMYGIPALYGIVASRIAHPDIFENSTGRNPPLSIFNNIKQSCHENTQSLIILGGYITFTNAFMVLVDFIPKGYIPDGFRDVLSAFIELTGGVSSIYQSKLSPRIRLYFIMVALSFGGISCFMQTSGFLEKSGLSKASYIKHKLAVTLLSVIYYLFIILL